MANTTILEKIRNAGVVGSGGAGLPTHVKANASIETVLVNGASCEPLLMSDPHLMENEIDSVISGLLSMMDCTGASKGIICLKGKHHNAMKSVKEAVKKEGSGRLECFELHDFYPAGDEQVMLKEVLGKVVPERGLPLQVGAVVSNVETLYNVAHAMKDIPTTHRYLTIEGEITSPMVVKVPVGTPISEVIAFAGGAKIKDYKVVDGGPMMGRVLADNNGDFSQLFVTKTTSGLLILPPDHNVVTQKTKSPERTRQITNTICCQCTRCTDLCPRNLLGHSLHPHKLMRVLHNHELESEVAKEALLCSECGVCEKFACPMMISPREVNAQLKKILMKEGIAWKTEKTEFHANPYRSERRIPTKRLIQRLNIVKYDTHPTYKGAYEPKQVSISLRQHIGAPAQCVVSVGTKVKCGDLIGEIPENAMGARVHATINGTVTGIENGIVTIKS